MSGSSYRGYSGSIGTSIKDYTSDDSSTVASAVSERRHRIEKDRRRIIDDPAPAPPPVRDEREVYDQSLARNTVKAPDAKAERVHVVLIDNSGSNRIIAEHIKKTSGYLLATLGAVDPGSRLCCVYFSDHCDGHRIWQPVDFVAPDEMGDKILHSSIQQVEPANGGDEPEAIECALWDACDLPFGEVKERHLYLVTDTVAHGMGIRVDKGCPRQRDWRKSLKRVSETYASFEVVGCGEDDETTELQKKFIQDPARLALDLISLSSIPSHQHRCGITGNAILFLIARHQGRQAVEAFLMALYEKWLHEPIFGANTDLGAREAIKRFTKYIEAPPDDIKKMLKKIFS